jgi:hypothetical protein
VYNTRLPLVALAWTKGSVVGWLCAWRNCSSLRDPALLPLVSRCMSSYILHTSHRWCGNRGARSRRCSRANIENASFRFAPRLRLYPPSSSSISPTSSDEDATEGGHEDSTDDTDYCSPQVIKAQMPKPLDRNMPMQSSAITG